MQSLFDWLSRHGVDCSRTANEDDALVLLMVLALAIAFAVAFISPWWSGFLTAATTLTAGCWVKHRH